MKKVISMLMVAVALMVAAPAQAQLIKFGVKGGMSFSKLDFDAKSVGDVKDNSTGWFIGPMAEVTLPIVGIGVDVAALYSQTKLSGTHNDSDFDLKSIEVPVNLKWSFGMGSTLGAYLAAGPQFSFNVGDRSDMFWDLKKNSTSFNVGAGLKLLRHLQVGVNYNFGLGKIGEYYLGAASSDIEKVNDYAKLKNNSWQVSLAYTF